MITIILVTFFLGYLMIAFEEKTKINKAAISLLTGGIIWCIIGVYTPDHHQLLHILEKETGEIAGILLFLMGAMTIVEFIALYDGFGIVTKAINSKNIGGLVLVVCLLTFFLSAILDNLTTTIVVVSILLKILPEGKLRLKMITIVIVAANAGGAWSPIGDVTTTMLWAQEKITSVEVIKKIFLPSMISLIVTVIFTFSIKSLGNNLETKSTEEEEGKNPYARFFLILGVVLLIAVPVIKATTHVSPWIAMAISLGILWFVSEKTDPDADQHLGENQENGHGSSKSIGSALGKIDHASILFFAGILLAVAGLKEIHVLHDIGEWLKSTGSSDLMNAGAIGVLSAIVDNVPIVAASMSLFDYGTDHVFWHMVAYTAGTGGSMLVIGSAAGVTAMGMDKGLTFGWYLKKMSFPILVGYLAGIGVIYLMS